MAGVQVGQKRGGGRGEGGRMGGRRGYAGRMVGRGYFENPEGLCIDLDMSSSKSPYPLSD